MTRKNVKAKINKIGSHYLRSFLTLDIKIKQNRTKTGCAVIFLREGGERENIYFEENHISMLKPNFCNISRNFQIKDIYVPTRHRYRYYRWLKQGRFFFLGSLQLRF